MPVLVALDDDLVCDALTFVCRTARLLSYKIAFFGEIHLPGLYSADVFLLPPRQEYRQGDQTRPPGGEPFGYRKQQQVSVTDDYGLGNRLPVTDAFRSGQLMQATKRFTQAAATQQPRSTEEYILPGTDGSMPRMPDTRTQQDLV
jgi:hypothetical protein